MLTSIFERNSYRRINLEDVFTPSSPVRLNYSRRDEYEALIGRSLAIPGMQILICGTHSSGKTSLIEQVLRKNKMSYIVTSCAHDTTVSQVITETFERLCMNNNKKRIRIIPVRRVLSFEPTPQCLGERLGLAGMTWIVDDVHRIRPEERVKFHEVLKTFSDLVNEYKAVKLIAVGTAHATGELLSFSDEIPNRLSEIYIEPVNEAQVDDLIATGEELLNISFGRKLREQIKSFSNLLPGIVHQLCNSICRQQSVLYRQKSSKQFGDDEINKAISSYLRSNADIYGRAFHKALQAYDATVPDTAGVLMALAQTRSQELFPEDILAFGGNRKKYAFNIDQCLSLLSSEVCLGILRFNSRIKSYSFADPFMKAYAQMYFAECEELKKHDKTKVHNNEWVDKMLHQVVVVEPDPRFSENDGELA